MSNFPPLLRGKARQSAGVTYRRDFVSLGFFFFLEQFQIYRRINNARMESSDLSSLAL